MGAIERVPAGDLLPLRGAAETTVVRAHRPVVMGERGMVAAGHHLAAEAGARVLREGGNAADAAVTAAATLAVAIPHMNGVGGDAFALWYRHDTHEVVTLNGSGAAPAEASLEGYRRRGLHAVPRRGPLSISVPGASHAWAETLVRFGTIPFARALQPAIELAERGTPVDAVLREFLAGPVYAKLCATSPSLAETFGAPGERRLGTRVRQPALARTLRALAQDGVAALYEGDLGVMLAADAQAAGALLTLEDLAAHRTLLQRPLRVAYRGYEVLSAPANTQGIALLLILGALARAGGEEPFLAQLLRFKHPAFAIRDQYVGDPARGPDLQPFLSADSLDRIVRETPSLAEAATDPGATLGGGDTSTLVAVDAQGNMMSWVQSLFEEFGSGVISPRTGVVLHNRLALASLAPGGPNELGAGRRPFHTLCPALVLARDGPRIAIATPGDHGQPQTLAQVLYGMLDGGLDVQTAIEAARVRHDTGRVVMTESRLDARALEPLRAAGYSIEDVGPWSRLMGGVNAVVVDADGLRMGGADPRRAGYVIAE